MNHYSEEAREAISQHLPALLSELREQPDGSLFMESLSPSGFKFWVSTEGNEVTVGFSLHHVHFGTPWEPDAAEDVCEASEYVYKLMSGQYRVAVWTRNGKFVQSETIEQHAEPVKVSRSWIGRWLLGDCSVEVHGW